MTFRPQGVTDAELSVLQILWELGTASVREITERLYPKGTQSLIATVQKLLERLEQKQCVERNRKTWPHQFSATVQRDALIAQQLQTTADKLCNGEIHPLLTSLVKTHALTLEDRKSLRGLLDELDHQKK
jgi:predicted transcriptional regulator